MTRSFLHTDPAVPVIFWGTALLFFGIMGRYLATRMRQPGVLGELLMGIFLGNLAYACGLPIAIMLRESMHMPSIMQSVLSGLPLLKSIQTVIQDPHAADGLFQVLSAPSGPDWIRTAFVVDVFSRYGVIFLLFMVGLDSSITELKRTGAASARVASIGVIVPVVMGMLLMQLLAPRESFYTHLFVAASLAATSVGITARVLKDMHQIHTREAQTILSAAMLDDVLGLLLLAVATQVVLSGGLNYPLLLQLFGFAAVFLTGALVFGPWVIRRLVSCLSHLPPWETKLLTAFLCLMIFSWLAAYVQLAAIVGAFMAGVILHDGFFEGDFKAGSSKIKAVFAPLEAIFAPLFFVLIGVQVNLDTWIDPQVLLIATGLIVVAVVGKLLSGLGAARGDDKLSIGLGMLPRGEVGLVFASIGKTLGVVSDVIFSAIIIMVIVTTVITPLCLTWRLRSKKRGEVHGV